MRRLVQLDAICFTLHYESFRCLEICTPSRQGDVHKKLRNLYRSIYLDSYGCPPVLGELFVMCVPGCC